MGIGLVALGCAVVWLALRGEPHRDVLSITPLEGAAIRAKTNERTHDNATERSHVASPAAEAPASAESSTEAHAQRDELALELDSCFSALQREAPDLAKVADWATLFAQAVEVDAASIEVDEDTGRIRGRLTGPAGLGPASFSIDGARLEVSLWPRVNGAEAASTPLRSVRWTFENAGGAAAKPHLGLQSHPDTNSSVSAFLDGREERIVGWSFGATERGASAVPTAVRAAPDEPGAWSIGRAQTVSTSDWPGYFIDGSHKVLLDKLAPFAKR